MSPDRTTITRAEAIRRRKEDEQNRQERGAQKNVSKIRSTSAPKADARPAGSMGRPARSNGSAVATSRLRNRYDLAMSVPHGRARSFAPQKSQGWFSINIPRPKPGLRLFSFFLVLFCAMDLYVMFSMDPFIVRSAHINGNNRISVQEIESASGAMDQPAAFINPLQLEHNIKVAFPDIDSVQVSVNIPAGLSISVSERTPVAAWQQDDKTVWVDAKGYAFPARGEAPNLVTINALGAPPTPVQAAEDPNSPPAIGAQAFLASDLTDEIKTLSSYVPQGTILVFDPRYGLGWSDPAGWTVYFGHSNGDTELKIRVYQAMIDYLSKNNLQPVLISVEYPNAPFFRLEQ